MATVVWNDAAFRQQFTAFADQTVYTPAMLQGYFTEACFYIDPNDRCLINGATLQLAVYLMVAHIAFINQQILNGQATSGVQTGATVGQVSVQLQPPPIKNGFQQWLAQSPYGLRLWGLLNIKGSAGFYIGGSRERGGFRKIGGGFEPT